MAFAMAVLAISGCGKTEPKEPAVPTTIKVTGVTLDRQTIDMTEGETTALTATVAPSNATDKSVTWSSSSTAVATVDSNGKVTAVKAGEATITVTTKDGGKSATCKVTVKAATVAVTGVEVDPAELSLVEGTSASIKATVTPENATDKDVSWTSSSADVATVDGNGKVTAVKAGEATPGADNIKVGWKPVDGATGYEVGYKKSSDGVWNAPVTVSATSHSITGLAAERAYDIRVRATDGKTFSEYSYKRYVVTTEAVNPDYTYDKATNTYTVKTAAGLMKWNEEARKDYKANCVLDADITLSAGSGEGNWTPVGYHINASNYRPFKGRFDGQGHTISNLTVDESEGVAGMFGKNEGTVMNLKLENASVSGISSAGGIAGRNDGSIIDCSFSGIVQGSSYVGGIAGENYKKISGCSFSGTVKQGSTGSTVGGIAGNSYHGEILDSHSHGTVTGNNNVGGIVGSAYTNGGVWSRIVACWSDASVNGNHSVGGIAGSCSGYADVISCYFIGKLVGKSSVGGIVGNVTGALSNNHITSCYSSGEITGDTNVGGIAGYLYKGSVITSCYWDKYSGAAVGSGSGESSSATMVDGSSVKWSTATAGMNAAIKSWNADATHSERQCEFHYVQTGTSLPTLVAGATE